MEAIGASACYGVDLGEGFAAVVRASRGGGAGAFRTLLSSSDGAASDGWRAVAAEMRAAAGRRRALVAAALPARDTVVRRLAAPMASLRRARAIFPSMLDVQLPFPLEECEAAYLDLRPAGPGRTAALAVASRRDALQRRVEECAAAGFDPMILDAEGLALWTRAAEELRPADGGLRVVAYAGADRAVMAAGRGRDLESVHTLRWNPREASDPARTAFLQRARQVLQSAHAEGDPPADWIWCGPGAASGGIADDLEAALGDAAVRFRRCEDPATFLARALAARGLRGGPLACNLRTGALQQPDLARWIARRADGVSAACVAAGLALAAVGAVWMYWLDGRVGAANRAVEGAAREVGRLARVQPGLEVRMAREAVQKRLEEEAALARAFQPGASGRLAGVLRVAAQNDLRIDTVELGDAAASVEGSGPNWDVCGRLDAFLKTVGYRTDLQRREAGADERVHFTIKGRRS